MPEGKETGRRFEVADLLGFRDDAYRLAVRMAGGTDAEDIVHDAYVRALKSALPDRDERGMRLWFLRIVANAARTHGSASASRRDREQEVAMSRSESQTPMQNHAAKAELLTALHTAIQSLDERHRTAICLHYEQGLTYEEAAEVADVPAGSLRAYASLGVRELREILERRGHAVDETSLCALVVAGVPLEIPARLCESLKLTLAQNSSAATAATKGLVVTTQAGGAALALKVLVALAVLAAGAGLYVWSIPHNSAAVPPAPPPPPVAKVETPPAAVPLMEEGPRRVTPVPAPVAAGVIEELRERYGNTPNRLESVVPEEHAVDGAWKRVDGDITSSAVPYSRISVPYHPGETYDVYLEFTRVSGVADINVMLPFGGRTLLWKMGAQGNTEFQFKGLTTPQRIPRRSPAIKDGVRNALLLEVRRDSVSATLNGELILREAIAANLTGEAAWNLPDQSAIGLGTWQTAARFHRLHVETLEGTARAIAGDTAAQEIAKAEHWKGARELLSRGVALPVIPEGWKVEDGVATSDDGRFSRLDLNYAAPEEYDLRTELVRNKGKSDVTLILGRAGKSFCLKMGTWGNFAHALDTIQGRYSGNSPAAVNGRLVNGQTYVVVVQMRKKSVRVFLDNREIITWPTDFSEFGIESNWAIRAGNLGIGSYEGSATFKRVQVKELSAPPKSSAGPGASEF